MVETELKRRRLDRVLDGAQLHDLSGLDVETLRSLRTDAVQEEAEQSYVRRLLQGRLDQLRDEEARRSAHADSQGRVRSDKELAEMLSSILTGPSGKQGPGASGGRVGGHYIEAEADHGAHRRRAAELAAADVRLSDPSLLDDAELAGACRRLVSLESQVSSVRRAVQAVADAVTAEMARRKEL